MQRTRRQFVVAAVVGGGGLLAGCIGGESNNGGNGSATGTTTGNSADSTATNTAEPITTEQSGSSTELTEPTTNATGSPTAEVESPSMDDSTPETSLPDAPTSPTTDLQVVSQGGALTITAVEVGPSGTDTPSIFREHVDFENTSDEPLDLAGYTVEYGGTGKSFEFPKSSSTMVDPGGSVRVTTGNGGETILPAENEFFAGFETPVLAIEGGVITVTDPDGKTVLKVRY